MWFTKKTHLKYNITKMLKAKKKKNQAKESWYCSLLLNKNTEFKGKNSYIFYNDKFMCSWEM